MHAPERNPTRKAVRGRVTASSLTAYHVASHGNRYLDEEQWVHEQMTFPNADYGRKSWFLIFSGKYVLLIYCKFLLLNAWISALIFLSKNLSISFCHGFALNQS